MTEKLTAGAKDHSIQPCEVSSIWHKMFPEIGY